MANTVLGKSAYHNQCIILTTKHDKSVGIAPAFHEILGASILEYDADTDMLGTFSGEVERTGTALECARRKCEWGMEISRASYGLASEGSFGPHPSTPLIACDQEILYFIDRTRNLHIHVSHISEKTNYRMQTVDSWEEALLFAQQAGFPSHGLVVRPNQNSHRFRIFKGVDTPEMLRWAFMQSCQHSADHKAWIETDMRAHMNPTRMKVIEELAYMMAERLSNHCPSCKNPGWGITRLETGLECSECGNETRLIKKEIHGCQSCGYEITAPALDSAASADPYNCAYCNP